MRRNRRGGRGGRRFIPCGDETLASVIGGPTWIRTKLRGLAQPLRSRSATGPEPSYQIIIKRQIAFPN